MKAAREKSWVTCKGKSITIAADFSMEIFKARRAWSNVLQVLKDHTDVNPNYCTQQNYLSLLKENKKLSMTWIGYKNLSPLNQLYQKLWKKSFGPWRGVSISKKLQKENRRNYNDYWNTKQDLEHNNKKTINWKQSTCTFQ